MRKWIAGLVASFMLIFGGIACDDRSPQETQKMDEDDTRPGPGDGGDETGPGR